MRQAGACHQPVNVVPVLVEKDMGVVIRLPHYLDQSVELFLVSLLLVLSMGGTVFFKWLGEHFRNSDVGEP